MRAPKLLFDFVEGKHVATLSCQRQRHSIGNIDRSCSPRDSEQEVVIYDIASGDKKRFAIETDPNPDDPNAPAFILRPDGGDAALWLVGQNALDRPLTA